MFNVKEYVKDLTDAGFSKEDALELAKVELKTRKVNDINDIKYQNDRKFEKIAWSRK